TGPSTSAATASRGIRNGARSSSQGITARDTRATRATPSARSSSKKRVTAAIATARRTFAAFSQPVWYRRSARGAGPTGPSVLRGMGGPVLSAMAFGGDCGIHGVVGTAPRPLHLRDVRAPFDTPTEASNAIVDGPRDEPGSERDPRDEVDHDERAKGTARKGHQPDRAPGQQVDSPHHRALAEHPQIGPRRHDLRGDWPHLLRQQAREGTPDQRRDEKSDSEGR